MIILHAIECECQECLDKWKKIESIEKKIGRKKKQPTLGEEAEKDKDRRKNEKDRRKNEKDRGTSSTVTTLKDTSDGK